MAVTLKRALESALITVVKADSDRGIFKVKIGKAEVTNIHSAYAEGTPGEVFVIVDSMGFLEIAMNRGAANRTIAADKGSELPDDIAAILVLRTR